MKDQEDRDLEIEEGLAPFSLNRREFMKLLGGGIFIFFTCGSLAAQARRPRAPQEIPTDFNAFLRIKEDGRVTCFTGKVELGQGSMTSLAQMLAEELDVPVSSVDMVMGDTDFCPWDMVTAGSRTTRFLGPPLRAAGAEAKAVLLKLAAEHLGAQESQLQVKDGVVIDRNNSKNKVTYAALSRGKTIERHLDPKPPLKPIADFTVIGKDQPRKDVLEKVTGEAKYAGDIRLPGMSGFNLQEHLIKSQSRIPVIFMTGHDRYQMEDEAMRLETIAYLRKPFDKQCLLDAIQLAYEEMVTEVNEQ